MRLHVLVVVGLLVLAGCVSFGGGDPAPSGTVDAPPSATPPSDGVEADVVEVVDGDTVKVVMPDGSRETARLLGVDTPEVYGENAPGEFEGVPDTEGGQDCLDRWAEEASSHTKERLLGETVTLQFDANEPRRGYYGRLLVYVFHDGREFNYGLVTGGLARVYDSSFQHRERYDEAEAAAMDAGAGLWACREDGDEPTPEPSSPEPSPTATPGEGDAAIRLVEVHEDAAGDDRQNLNDEYVVLKNAGDEPLYLSGWTVSDEANHRYTFPEGTTVAPGATLTLHTGSGEDTATDVYWNSSGAVWNNDGDTVTIRTASGEVVVERSYA